MSSSGLTGTIAVTSEALMQDFKAGQLLRSNPRNLTIAQLIAALAVYTWSFVLRMRGVSLVDQRLAEIDELEARAERYREIAQLLPHVVWTATTDGRIDFSNQRWFDYSGLSYEESAGPGWQAGWGEPTERPAPATDSTSTAETRGASGRRGQWSRR